MDYKKIYENSLAIAEKLVREGKISKEHAESMFSELKKSEDDRIRKTLIHIVKGACSKYGIKYQGQEISEEKLLAWIEKQGQQKPTDKAEPKYNVGDTIYYNSFGKVKSMIVANVVTDSTDNTMYEDENGNTVFEKDLIEHKPTDIQSIEKRAHEVFPDDDDENTPLYRQAFIDGAVDYIDCGCKNIAWSEEDEKMIRALVSMCDVWATSHQFYPKENKEMEALKTWLKSLKDRVQPQPQWSKMDDVRLTSTIEVLEFAHSLDSYNQYGKEDIRNNLSWLKSIKERYTWKPSDEQMKALAYAVFDTQSHSYHKNLSSLEQQLNKLKEK